MYACFPQRPLHTNEASTDSRARGSCRSASLPVLLVADYARLYRYKNESDRRQMLLLLPRLLTNPSLHAVLLIRVFLASPSYLRWLWRNILITKHGIDLHPAVQIGPGLELPHPVSIVIGGTTVLGSNVVLHHNVTLGTRDRHLDPRIEQRVSPVIGNDVIIYAGSVLVGQIRVGSGATIGANTVVSHDVPPGSTYTISKG